MKTVVIPLEGNRLVFNTVVSVPLHAGTVTVKSPDSNGKSHSTLAAAAIGTKVKM